MNLRWKIAQAFELRWWARYLGQKDKNSYLAWKKAYWRQLVGSLPLPFSPDDRILDAGCGPAGVFLVLEDYEVTGIDPLIEAYSEKVAHFRQDDYPHVQFEALPLEQMSRLASFDKVFCLNAINHVADLPLSLQNLWAAVKPGGTLILSTDAHRYKLLARIFRLLPGDILHPQQYTWPEYLDLFKMQGIIPTFEIVYKKGRIFDYWVVIVVKSEK